MRICIKEVPETLNLKEMERYHYPQPKDFKNFHLTFQKRIVII